MLKIQKHKYIFVISDLLILVSSLLITLFAAKILRNIDFRIPDTQLPFFILVIFLILSSFLIFSLNNLYKISLIVIRSAHLAAVLKSLLYFIVILLVSLLIIGVSISEIISISIIFLFSFITLTYIIRVELLRRAYLYLKMSVFRKSVIIVGDGEPGKMLAAKLAFENPVGLNIIGFLDEKKDIGEEIINGKKILGRYSDIHNIIKQYEINEILIADDTKDYEKLLEIVDYCQETKLNVKITSDLFKIIPQKLYTEKYENLPVIDLAFANSHWLSIKIKRIFDFCIAMFGFILLSPLFVLIALGIKLTSKGPVFYSQIRIGKNGKAFKFYKFRTMIVINEEDKERKEKMIKFMKESESSSNETKIKSDWRITKIGKILRKTSIDELPQLFNVIKGDMSLVGPRPCLSYEFENYDNWQKRRLSVTPGCTGVWQVVGRSSVSFKDSIVLDLYYINNMSPWLDLQLMIKTIPVMLLGKGGG